MSKCREYREPQCGGTQKPDGAAGAQQRRAVPAARESLRLTAAAPPAPAARRPPPDPSRTRALRRARQRSSPGTCCDIHRQGPHAARRPAAQPAAAPPRRPPRRPPRPPPAGAGRGGSGGGGEQRRRLRRMRDRRQAGWRAFQQLCRACRLQPHIQRQPRSPPSKHLCRQGRQGTAWQPSDPSAHLLVAARRVAGHAAPVGLAVAAHRAARHRHVAHALALEEGARPGGVGPGEGAARHVPHLLVGLRVWGCV